MPLANGSPLGLSNGNRVVRSNGAPLDVPDMSSVGSRIEKLRQSRQPAISQAELARRVGMSQGALNGLILGNARTSRYLPQIARELGTSVDYLTGEVSAVDDDRSRGPTPSVVAEQLNSVLVPFYDEPYGLGGTFVALPAGRAEMVPFMKDWLRSRMTGGFDELLLLPGRGDSMEPTIRDGDVLLIDRAQREVREQDQIWAFDYGEIGMVKRLRRRPRGGYVVQSDNAVVKDFTAGDDEVQLVGRVISIMQWK